jgi:uncharacterized membrane protein YfcA
MDTNMDVTSVAFTPRRRYLVAWIAVGAAAVILALADGWSGWLGAWTGAGSRIAYPSLVLLLLALGCEFIDATIGMGYGTTLTPILMLLGYPIHAIIPAAVLSQLAGNLSAAYFHHQVGNVDFLRDSKARNTGLVLGLVGMAVAMVTVFVTVRVPADILKPLVSVVVLGLGIFLLVGTTLQLKFRWRNVAALAFVAGFNKSFTGGGYGPLVCGGQVLVGLNVRAAVASTALAEAVVCIAIVVAYIIAGVGIPMELLLPLVAGSLLSTPASAMALRKLPHNLVRKLMGIAVSLLGALSLLKLIGGV